MEGRKQLRLHKDDRLSSGNKITKRPRLAPLQRRSLSAGCASGLTTHHTTAETNAVALWPAPRTARSLDHIQHSSSRAPLALQIEGFLRKEHRQYLTEHPGCSRVETLHIFREAFGVLSEHFPEYQNIFNIIRDEYDAVIAELTEQIKKMKLVDLDNKSDRSVHAMELMQLKENLNAVISNQQAQLLASQGLVHSLREQLAAAEHANSLLKYDLDQHSKEYEEANEKVRLISKAMIEESARTLDIVEQTKKKDKEIDLLNAKIKVLRENVQELEGFLRGRAQDDVYGRLPTAAEVPTAGKPEESPPAEDYLALLKKIDEECFSTVIKEMNVGPESVVTVPTERKTDSSIFYTWLRSEGIVEEDLKGYGPLLPPGLWEGEEFSFLGMCHPVPDQHLTVNDTAKLVSSFWDYRELERSSGSKLKDSFLKWLQSQCGGQEKGRSLGLNMLHVCQRAVQESECRLLLFALRGFLPEALVNTSRALVRQFTQLVETGIERNGDSIEFENLFGAVRQVYPEKSLVNMMHLRFYVFQAYKNDVNFRELLRPNSVFIKLLKHQFAAEVEEFTLSIVEGIRAAADRKGNVVRVTKILEVFQSVDPGMSRERIHHYVADGSQKSLIDIATADNNTIVRLDSLLLRYRTCVLLRRSTQPPPL